MLLPTLAKNIIYGDLAQVRQYLAINEESIHDLDEYGYTPLIEAIIFNKEEIVDFLLESGVNINEPSITGHSALYWAVENNNPSIAAKLLKLGANPNAYSRSSQPIMILPLLRQQHDLKDLLYQYGADLHFAQDYIATKLLAHRFELIGHVDLTDNTGKFIELDLEGFFLEFTIGIIQHSLGQFKNHFAAKHLRDYFYPIQQIIEAFNAASELIKYQHFAVKPDRYQKRISQLLNRSLQVIPVAYEGHAICFVRYRDILVKCDRGVEGRKNGSVVIYRMQHPAKFNNHYIQSLLYTKQSQKHIVDLLPQELGLTPVTQLPIPTQVTGNCSWANIEAAVPTILFLLLIEKHTPASTNQILECKRQALSIYHDWHKWDQQTSLHEFIVNTQKAQGPRRVSKAMVLATLLFQKLNYMRMENVRVAEKVLPVLMQPDLQYILKSYKKIFVDKYKTSDGSNLIHLMELCGYSFKLHE